ncbi:uncharacterized protein LOC131345089 [Hemibagrus wyckioides]|uniref:uncharacterized protein LOC131345089 n=1 Tax=Hemibagrus wyckioides TaxID=337641 RepID=UPI00266DD72F|nr:uncharacterized protein LOC131345089 [Hemibagrus wyckioides]
MLFVCVYVYSETALDNKGRTKSSPCNMFITQSELRGRLVRRRHSAELNSYLWSTRHHPAVILTATSPIDTDVGLSHAESSQCIEDETNQDAEETELEHDYDVLPPCKPLHTKEEPIYDTPPSNRRLSEREPETTENIYDVPKPALRKRSVNEASCAKELPEITGLLHDMVICLGGTSADWVRATASGTTCQP